MTESQRCHWSESSEARYTDNAIEMAAGHCRPALIEYSDWLRDGLGLAQSTITNRVADARKFAEWVTAVGGPSVAEAMSALSASSVEAFFVEYCSDASSHRRRSMQAAMRSFLRFAVARGWCSESMLRAVPSLSCWRLASVPRGPAPADVDRLVSAMTSGVACARDRSLVLILATYGVRRGQLAALQLEDVDWRGRSITFQPHKGGRRVVHALTSGLAAPLAEYLRHERPASDSPRVFLRRKLPHLPLSPGAVSAVVHTQLRRLGIQCTPMGPHGLRHAFATRLLSADQSMKTIADLLGHRSLAATSIYAKVDHPRLLEVAQDWPEVSA